jgi:hypothetical protein
MAMAAPGYLRPVQEAPLAATEEAAIARTCPGLGQSVTQSPPRPERTGKWLGNDAQARERKRGWLAR